MTDFIEEFAKLEEQVVFLLAQHKEKCGENNMLRKKIDSLLQEKNDWQERQNHTISKLKNMVTQIKEELT